MGRPMQNFTVSKGKLAGALGRYRILLAPTEGIRPGRSDRTGLPAGRSAGWAKARTRISRSLRARVRRLRVEGSRSVRAPHDEPGRRYLARYPPGTGLLSRQPGGLGHRPDAFLQRGRMTLNRRPSQRRTASPVFGSRSRCSCAFPHPVEAEGHRLDLGRDAFDDRDDLASCPSCRSGRARWKG